jgi:hypothetical protein
MPFSIPPFAVSRQCGFLMFSHGEFSCVALGREVQMRKKKVSRPEMTAEEWLEQDEMNFWAKPFEERAAVYLPHFRKAAQKLEWWKTCFLPACRRARRCSGVVDPKKIVHQWELATPACCQGREERKFALMREAAATEEVSPRTDAEI